MSTGFFLFFYFIFSSSFLLCWQSWTSAIACFVHTLMFAFVCVKSRRIHFRQFSFVFCSRLSNRFSSFYFNLNYFIHSVLNTLIDVNCRRSGILRSCSREHTPYISPSCNWQFDNVSNGRCHLYLILMETAHTREENRCSRDFTQIYK